MSLWITTHPSTLFHSLPTPTRQLHHILPTAFQLPISQVSSHPLRASLTEHQNMNSFNCPAFLIATCLSHFTFSFTIVHAQSSPDPRVRMSLDLSLYIMIIALVSAFAFMGLFFSLSLRYCWRSQARRQATLQNPTASFNFSPHGVDQTLLHSFPILVYSTIKQHKIGKGVHECAVCLSEFRDCDTLMLLPKCDHVFHPHCIHAWLAFHVTCPVCRANLTENPDSCGCGTTVVEIPTHIANGAMDSETVNSNANSSGQERDDSEKGQQQVVMRVYPEETAVNMEEEGYVRGKEKGEAECRRSQWRDESVVEAGSYMERAVDVEAACPEEVGNSF